MFLGISDCSSSQACLPSCDSSIDDDRNERPQFEKQLFGFSSPVFLALGHVRNTIFFAFGIVLFKKTPWG